MIATAGPQSWRRLTLMRLLPRVPPLTLCRQRSNIPLVRAFAGQVHSDQVPRVSATPGTSHGTCQASAGATAVRRNHAARRVVGAATRRLRHPLIIRRLRHLGCVAGRSLHLRAVPVALLLAGAVRQLTACLVRTQARVVAALAGVLPRPPDLAVPGTVQADLLLLPRRLLQGVLGRSAGLRRR